MCFYWSMNVFVCVCVSLNISQHIHAFLIVRSLCVCVCVCLCVCACVMLTTAPQRPVHPQTPSDISLLFQHLSHGIRVPPFGLINLLSHACVCMCVCVC